ncbi:MAG TPA: ABC transporter permease, partial [Acidobacteriaceae bacterium]|nr:ABC transporter permease [Acidobacteriaceae bacterium]
MAAGLLQEIRYALRQLGKSPGFTLLAIGTLALGIGANTTILSWISATLLHPIPGVAQTGRMNTLQRGERSEHPTPPLSYLDYADLRRQAKTVSGMLAYHDDFMALTGSGKPERIYGALVSANYFDVLGVQAALGRTLADSLDAEQAGQADVVLGFDLWRNHF